MIMIKNMITKYLTELPKITVVKDGEYHIITYSMTLHTFVGDININQVIFIFVLYG